MTLRSFAFVLGLSLVPAFVAVESVDVPAAHAWSIDLLEAQIGRLERASLKVSQLSKQAPPAGASKVETGQWYKQTQLLMEIHGFVDNWHVKLTDILKRAKNGQASSADDDWAIHFETARKEMLLKLKTLSPSFPACKTRHEAAQQ